MGMRSLILILLLLQGCEIIPFGIGLAHLFSKKDPACYEKDLDGNPIYDREHLKPECMTPENQPYEEEPMAWE